MTNVTVVFEYEEPEYCRLCLSEPTKHNELTTLGKASASDEHKAILTIIRELLKIELDPEKDSGSFICSTCLESLVEFHQYRIRCQSNDDALQKKATERKQKQIELAKSAIQNTDVLDQVKDGDPIKVIIRMNAEGKASVRLQVQSKQPVVEAPPKPSDPPPPAPPQKKPPATPRPVVVPAIPAAAVAGKPIKLPKQEFYFYKTINSSCGLVYGGYRYSASIPRRNGTHWICEQRRSLNCMSLLYVDKTYNAFYLHSDHMHEPPPLRTKLSIYKASDVLCKVIEKEKQIRILREAKKENNSNDKERLGTKALDEAFSSTDMQIKDESDSELDSSDEEEDDDDDDEEMDSSDDLSVLANSKPVDVQLVPIAKVKEEPLPKAAAPSAQHAKGIKINAGDNTYFIQELT